VLFKAFGKIKKSCFYLLNLCANHAVLSFFSFLCDNLLLQKCVQSLCEMTVFLCVNLIDPSKPHRPMTTTSMRTRAQWTCLTRSGERARAIWTWTRTPLTPPCSIWRSGRAGALVRGGKSVDRELVERTGVWIRKCLT